MLDFWLLAKKFLTHPGFEAMALKDKDLLFQTTVLGIVRES